MGKIIELQSYRGKVPRQQEHSVLTREEIIIDRFKKAELRYIGYVNKLFYNGQKASSMRKALSSLGRDLDIQNEELVKVFFDSHFSGPDGLAMRSQATLFATFHHREQLANKNLPFGIRVFLQQRCSALNERIREYRKQYSSEA